MSLKKIRVSKDDMPHGWVSFNPSGYKQGELSVFSAMSGVGKIKFGSQIMERLLSNAQAKVFMIDMETTFDRLHSFTNK